jgi:hypothetical protein
MHRISHRLYPRKLANPLKNPFFCRARAGFAKAASMPLAAYCAPPSQLLCEFTALPQPMFCKLLAMLNASAK